MSISRSRQAILLFTLAVCLIGCPSPTEKGNDPIHPAASLPKTAPWDLAALSKAPTFKWVDEKGKIRSLLYQGPPYKGKPTSVFAYYATPGSISGDTSRDRDLPAIVLLHGGGGRAYKEWVELWARRGYAAIAMDLSGRGADLEMEKIRTITPDTLLRAPRKRLPDGGPDQSDEVKFGELASPDADQWSYHAVANVILAHSLIRSFKEVDAGRTAIEGISWGGYVTLIAVSLDDRFKAAVNVYGSGFLHESSYWKEWFDKKMTSEQRERWVKLWDPSTYVGLTTVPILFITGVADQYYPIDSFAKTYRLVAGTKNIHVDPVLVHAHYFIKQNLQPPLEIELFVDQNLKDGTPLPKVTNVKVFDDKIFVEINGKTRLTSAALCYTRDTGEISKRNWETRPEKIEGSKVTAEPPPHDATIWFITVTDERGAVVSSEPVFAKAGDH